MMGARTSAHSHLGPALFAMVALCCAAEEPGNVKCARGVCAVDHAMIQQRRAVVVQASASPNVPKILLHHKGVGPQDIEPSLAQLASDVVAGKITLSNDTKVVLAGIHDAMESVISNTALSFQEDQREVNRSYDAIKDCDHNVREDMSSQLANQTSMREQSHHQCRLAEKQMKESRDSRCGEFQAIIAQASPPAFPSRPSVWTYDEARKFIAFSETYESWATGYNASLEIAKQKCDGSASDHAAHRSSCNEFQTAFETQFCDYHTVSTRMCASYWACRNKTAAAQSEVHEAVAKVEVGRRAEYSAAKHVQCYLRVLDADASEQVDQFNLCKVAVISTAHLEITYNPMPDAVECDISRVGQPPCHEEFLSMYYTSKGWYDEAPAETCSSCPEQNLATSATPTPPAPAASEEAEEEWILTSVASSARATTSFWSETCKSVPDDALYVRVQMGSMVDYFRPEAGATYCSMLTGNNQHQHASSPSGPWHNLSGRDSRHLGGGTFPATSHRVPYWGSDKANSGGCCVADASLKQAWNRAFDMYFAATKPIESMLTSVASSARRTTSFWSETCKSVPDDALYVKVQMGSMADYFRPVPGATYCSMLTGNDKHQHASSPFGPWHNLSVPDSRHLGGGTFPATSHRVPYWGSDKAYSGGCCVADASLKQAWNRAFDVFFAEA